MQIAIIAAGAAALCLSAPALGQTGYQESMAAAGQAFEDNDWPALNQALDNAQAARPYSLYIYRNRILALMLAGRQSEALALADDAAARGLTLALTGHPAFDDLAALPEFAPIAARMEANAAPSGSASATREFANAALLPEALAFDKKQTLYVGSVRNGAILSAKPKHQRLTKIVTAPGGVFDIEIRSDVLWAAVNNQLVYENADPDAPFAAIERGETVRSTFVNDTAFPHGIHLHGHHFYELAADESLGDLRDTTLVAAGESRDVLCVFDNPGRWLIHCHMLSHAIGGMRTWVEVT